MARRPLVWVTEQIHPEAMTILSSRAEVIGPGPAPEARMAEIDGMIVRAATVTPELLSRLPALKVVGKHGAGTDAIDVPALEAAGVVLFSTPGANADSVADLALAMALMLVRNPVENDAALRRGEKLGVEARTGYELSELRCGIVGLGAIGRGVARRLIAGFGARVTGHDPFLPEDRWPEAVARQSDLDRLLAATDLLFLHLPLVEQTRGLIGARELALMPKRAFLVNCARGGIVDETALALALSAGDLAGAASDVFEQEPPSPDNPLFAAPHFIGLPHLGGQTHAALHRTGMTIVNQVLGALDRAVSS